MLIEKNKSCNLTTVSLLQRGEVPLGRFLNEESAVGRVKFNMILKNLKIFFKILIVF